MYIENNDHLTTIPAGLFSKGVAGDLRIADNPALTSVAFPPGFAVNDLEIADNPALTNVTFPPGFAVGGLIVLSGNPIGCPLPAICDQSNAECDPCLPCPPGKFRLSGDCHACPPWGGFSLPVACTVVVLALRLLYRNAGAKSRLARLKLVVRARRPCVSARRRRMRRRAPSDDENAPRSASMPATHPPLAPCTARHRHSARPTPLRLAR